MKSVYDLALEWGIYTPSEIDYIRNLPNGSPTDIFIGKHDYRTNTYYKSRVEIKSKFESRALTTGSSGEPFTMIQSLNARFTKGLRFYKWLKSIRGDSPLILLWRNKKPSIKQKLEIKLGKLVLIPIYDIANPSASYFDDSKAKHIYAICSAYKGGVLRTYVSVLIWLCRTMGTKLKLLNLKCVIASAETLSVRDWDYIENCFGCPCINIYGGTEASPIAASTLTSRNLYIFDDLFKLNTSKQADGHRIIVTDYHNFAMPLVSYDIGDLTTGISEDIDGLYLNDVIGRVSEMLVNEEGFQMTSHFIHIVFRDLPEIQKYRLYWISHGKINLDIETLDLTLTDYARSLILERFKTNGFSVDIINLKKIEQLDGLKHRAVIKI